MKKFIPGTYVHRNIILEPPVEISCHECQDIRVPFGIGLVGVVAQSKEIINIKEPTNVSEKKSTSATSGNKIR